MKKTYQPDIIDKSDELVELLKTISFFEDYNITDLEPAREKFAEELTRKFLDGDLEEPLFTDEEWTQILKEIVTLDTLNSLKEKGLISSYSDDTTEEIFFLTEMGKQMGKKILGDNEK